MPTINQLSPVDEVLSGDQLPIWVPTQGDTRKATVNQVSEYVSQNLDYAAIVANLDIAASDVSFAPDVGISAVNVQDAIEEVVTDLAASGGAALVGFAPSGTLSSTTVQAAVTEVVTDLAASSGSSLVGFLQSGTGATARTVQAKLRDVVSVKDFGAVGDGVTDDTAAIQAAIDSITLAGTIKFPQGVYKITNTINILGNTRNLTLVGDNGIQSIAVGGALVNTASIIRWHGSANGVMFLLDSIEGTQIERLGFETYSTSQNVIDISGVYGIRYINKSSCRMSTITECSFRRLYAGIHYYDDGSGVSSNTNMDGHLICQCLFSTNVIGILVDQTNVYDTEVFRCSFYGSTSYTKHHVWIVKGHLYLQACYLGVLKDAASVGGKDGIAVYVQTGLIQITDTYSEAHNGPFFVWEVAEPTGVSAGITNCIILNQTATLPTTYNLLNKSASNVTIFGGRIAGNLSQYAGTTGSIACFGTYSVGIDSTSEPDKVSYFGAVRSGYYGAIGTMPTGTSGGGKATLEGYSPTFKFVNDTDGTSLEQVYASSILAFNKPGYFNGPKFNFSTQVVDLASASWSVQVSGSAGAALKYTAGTANGTVATTLGSVGPTGSNAGNPLGWLRVNVAGTDRYVPYW